MKPSPKLIAFLRWLLLVVAGLATVAGLLVVVENWRGERAWAAAERELLARGEKLDFVAFQPRAIPDEQNFLKAPQLARILYERADDPERPKLLSALRLDDFHSVEKFRGPLKDFTALRDDFIKRRVFTSPPTANPARDILTALQPTEPLLAELREAARTRPLAALDPSKSPFEPPEFAPDKTYRVGQVLGIHAAASIELGHTDVAFADVVALQRLANALAGPPRNLLQVLIALALHGVATGAIADGVERHAWTEPQLARFQQLFADFQPLARFADAMRTERAASLHILDTLPSKHMANVGWRTWYPRGWAQQNKVAYVRGLDAQIFAAFTVSPERIFGDRIPLSQKSGGAKKSRSPLTVLSDLSLTNIAPILENYGTSAEKLRLHAVTWAIERHRLAHGSVPATLAELVPAYLGAPPADLFTGQPLRYEKLSASAFRLYALGKNTRDDAGKDDDIALTPAGGP